jgi:hypothetical protein
MRLSRPGLPIGQNSGIVAVEAAEDEVARANLKDVFLVCLLVEDTIKREGGGVDLQLI